MFQDAAGTVPVTAPDQPVGLLLDKSGNAAHASQSDNAKRPIYRVIAGQPSIEFSRTAGNSFLQVSDKSLFAGIASAYVGAAASYGNVALTSCPVLFASMTTAGSTRLLLGLYNAAPQGFFGGRRLSADTVALGSYGDLESSVPVVLSAQVGYVRNSVEMYRDGVLANTIAPFQGSGNSVAVDSLNVDVGRFGGSATNTFTGHLYGMVIRVPELDPDELDRTEAYLSGLTEAPLPEEINVVLVGGQSNADGRVPVADGPAWISGGSVPDVLAWNGSALIPYDVDSTGPSGIGSSWVQQNSAGKYSFVSVALKSIAETTPNLVAVQVTSGGTPLAPESVERGSWCPDFAEIPDDGTPHLLSDLAARYASLYAFCTSNGITLNVIGMLWHQGESDSAYSGAPAAYQGRLEDLVAYLRAEVDDVAMPFVFGTISHASMQYDATIETAQLTVAANDANAYCRDNSAATLLVDGLHFDATSSDAFGEWAATQLGA